MVNTDADTQRLKQQFNSLGVDVVEVETGKYGVRTSILVPDVQSPIIITCADTAAMEGLLAALTKPQADKHDAHRLSARVGSLVENHDCGLVLCDFRRVASGQLLGCKNAADAATTAIRLRAEDAVAEGTVEALESAFGEVDDSLHHHFGNARQRLNFTLRQKTPA